MGVAARNQHIYDHLLRPGIMPVKAPQMTLLMAIAATQGIRRVTGLEAGIKWPNDIVSLTGKKLCGILTEMSAEIDYINYVVIGIGVNVNQELFRRRSRSGRPPFAWNWA